MQTKAIADLEIKVNTVLANSSTLEKARQEVVTNLRAARVESMSSQQRSWNDLPRFRQGRGGQWRQLSFPKRKSFLTHKEKDSNSSKETAKQARCRHQHYYQSNRRSQKEATRTMTRETMITMNLHHQREDEEDTMKGVDPGILPVLSSKTHDNWTRTNLLRPSHWQPTS